MPYNNTSTPQLTHQISSVKSVTGLSVMIKPCKHLSSPAHAPVFECEECDWSFGDDQALQDLNSPAQFSNVKSVIGLSEVTMPYNNILTLQLMHLYSNAKECDRSFESAQTLQQHRKSPHHTSVSLPLTWIKRGRNHSSQWKLKPEIERMMDMSQGQHWSLCDKDCSWCGHW
jgi:hypothetical protein